MAAMFRASRFLAILAAIQSIWMAVVLGLPMEYCATVNTNATMTPMMDVWQSNGLCYGYCSERNFAFAIVQWQSCWCSDVAPSSSVTVSTNRCSRFCPGFDKETCGGNGVFGYLALGRNPTATSGGVPSPTLPPDQSEPIPTAFQTVTADGTVRTVFVTPTASPGISGGTTGSQGPGLSTTANGPGTGAVVGIVVGVIGFVVLAALAIFCIYLARRKKRQSSPPEDFPSQRGSSVGMMNTPKAEMSDSAQAGWGPSGVAPPPLAKRSSRLMPVDPRMDPFHLGIYARNKSHESVNTLRDEHDYSRRVHQPKVLRAMNPDPHPAD